MKLILMVVNERFSPDTMRKKLVRLLVGISKFLYHGILLLYHIVIANHNLWCWTVWA